MAKVLGHSTWLFLALTFLCFLRSIHLNYISRYPLRSLSSPQYQHSDGSVTLAPGAGAADRTTVTNTFTDDVVLSDDTSNLFYFIQVSDLHISKFRSQTLHFLHFIQSVLPVIQPSFVVVTGDLTDAKDQDMVKTQQYEEEWELYKNAVDQGSNLPWYDMRGNHDCFDSPSWQSDVNLYRSFGKSAHLLEEGQGVYAWQVNQSYGQYRFVAMDACPKRGPARPLNFYGYLTTNTMDQLASTLSDGKLYNHTFLFTHYPTTTMVFGQSSQGYTFNDLLRQASIYFCGHLHRLYFGLGDTLKSYDLETRTLELELGDMKDHGVYRILAIDHDLVSFVDVELPSNILAASNKNDFRIPLTDNKTVIWPDKARIAPIVLITNPKDARYLLPGKEPIHRIRNSTHIRFMIFSEYEPELLKVRIFVDNKPHPFPAIHNKEHSINSLSLPLWTSSWTPEDFDDLSAHSLRIQCLAPDGQVGESEIIFRIDGIRLKIGGGFGEWLISTSVATIFKCVAIGGLILMIVLLLGPKTYTEYVIQQQQRRRLQSQSGDDVRHDNTVTPSTRIMLALHRLDADPYAGPYQCIHRQSLAWILRFFQFPIVMPIVFNTTLLFLLSFTCLPWFRAEFIPSANRYESRYGTFYLWGLLFGEEWLPLGDSWMFATFHLCFDVGVFLMLFAWRTTDVEDLYCSNATTHRLRRQQSRQWNRSLWFKALEIVYWIWRMSSVLMIGSFYGGLWPALTFNLLVLWMIFVAGVLLFGKDGMVFYRSQKSETRLRLVLDGCPSCFRLSSSVPLLPDYAPISSNDSTALDVEPSFTNFPEMRNEQDAVDTFRVLPPNHDNSDDFDSSSSSSSSNYTIMNGVRVKIRRKGNSHLDTQHNIE